MLETVTASVFDLFTVTDLVKAEKCCRQLSFRIIGGTIKFGHHKVTNNCPDRQSGVQYLIMLWKRVLQKVSLLEFKGKNSVFL